MDVSVDDPVVDVLHKQTTKKKKRAADFFSWSVWEGLAFRRDTASATYVEEEDPAVTVLLLPPLAPSAAGESTWRDASADFITLWARHLL